jgi:hypothetical protein
VRAAAVTKEFRPLLPSGYRPVVDGNITWDFSAHKLRYVEVYDLLMAPSRNVQLRTDMVVNDPGTAAAAPNNAIVFFGYSVASSPDQTLNPYFIQPQKHAALINFTNAQMPNTYVKMWNYEADVATGIDIIAYLNETSAAVDPLEGYDQYDRPNWDGFDAEPITPETLRHARALHASLPVMFSDPHIAPGADGTIGFYWSDNGAVRSLCIDVGPGAMWRAYWRLRDGRFDRRARSEMDATTPFALEFLFANLSR